MRIQILMLSGALALSACVPPPPPPAPQPAPKPVAPPPAPVQPQRPAAEWIDWPLAAGDWAYRRDPRGSIALFGPQGTDATVTLRCDTGLRRIYLSREGAGTGGRIVVRSSSSMKEFAASLTGTTPAYLTAEITPNDPILDAIALSRGRFAIEADGMQPIAIPSWAEITRIVEDCRA